MDALKSYIESRIFSVNMSIRNSNKLFNTLSYEEFMIKESYSLFFNERILIFYNSLKELIETETKENVFEYLKNTKEQCVNVLTKSSIHTTTNPIQNVLNNWEISFFQYKINTINGIISIFG